MAEDWRSNLEVWLVPFLARKIHESVGFGVLRGSDVGSLGARRT